MDKGGSPLISDVIGSRPIEQSHLFGRLFTLVCTYLASCAQRIFQFADEQKRFKKTLRGKIGSVHENMRLMETGYARRSYRRENDLTIFSPLPSPPFLRTRSDTHREPIDPYAIDRSIDRSTRRSALAGYSVESERNRDWIIINIIIVLRVHHYDSCKK